MRWAIAIGIVALTAVMGAAWKWQTPLTHWASATVGNRPLLQAKSWHYNLMDLDYSAIDKTAADLIVTEYSSSQADKKEWKNTEMAALKTKPAGGRRTVLSYFSIGEAESYRFYWKPEWSGDAVPDWYVAENCAWPRNFMVRFWLDSWKDIMFRSEGSFLNRIMSAGFDGVYLDRVDVFWEQLKERPPARANQALLLSPRTRKIF